MRAEARREVWKGKRRSSRYMGEVGGADKNIVAGWEKGGKRRSWERCRVEVCFFVSTVGNSELEYLGFL